MKNKLAKKLLATLSGVVALAGAPAAHALISPYVLTINDSNPAAVVIMATGSFATASSSTNTGADGFDLLGFFTSYQNYGVANNSGGTLQGGGLATAYNYYELDNKSGLYTDLNFYIHGVSGSTNVEVFSTSQAAFTGTWTVNLAALGINVSALPAAGAQGSVMSGYSTDAGNVIGQWQVVPAPEPGTVTILSMGALVATITPLRRRFFAKK